MAAPSDLTALVHYIHQRFAKKLPAVTESTSLVKSGLVDSFGVIDIVSFLEKEYGVRLPDAEVTPDHFENLTTIRALLARCCK